LGFGYVNVESGDADPDYFARITGGQITVDNDFDQGNFDNCNVQAGGLGACGSGITGSSVNGWDLCGFELGLLDVDGRVFDSDALPLSPPDLEEFTGAGDFGFLRLLFTRKNELSVTLDAARSPALCRAFCFCTSAIVAFGPRALR
jgi:hypothetical protein